MEPVSDRSKREAVTPVPSGATKRSKLGAGAQDVLACGGHFLTAAL